MAANTHHTGIKSTATSIPATDSPFMSKPPEYQPRNLPSTKRKHGQEWPTTMSDKKRRKTMGRPKNDWTPSRRRKLVRLYLMTNLEVPEIARVLQAKNFKPCSRDVQKQLKSLLQPRPNKIRFDGQITKQRLVLLRECQRLPKPYHTERHGRSVRTVVKQFDAKHHTISTKVDPNIVKSSQIELDWFLFNKNLECEVPVPSLIEVTPEFIKGGNKELPLSSFGSSSVLPVGEEIGIALSDISQELPLEYEHVIPDFPLFEFGLQANFIPRQNHTTEQGSSYPLAPRRSMEYWDTKTQDGIQPAINPEFATEVSAADSVSVSGKSSRSTVLSFRNLRNRMSTRYSDSSLDEILSVLNRFTISGSSRLKSSLVSQSDICAQDPCAEYHAELWEAEKEGRPAARREHLIQLPGSHPESSKEHEQISFKRCMHRVGQQSGRHKSETENSASGGSTHLPYYACKCEKSLPTSINALDKFGNSGLHVAASLGFSTGYILSLIVERGADVHIVNNAGEYFLHVLSPMNLEDCRNLQPLLEELQKKSFNFAQRNHHGQTAIHRLTRPWKDPVLLGSIVRTLYELNIRLPSSRDNLGWTVSKQLDDPQIDASNYDPGRLLAIFGISGVTTFDVYGNNGTEKQGLKIDKVARQYESHSIIQTIEDLQRYEQHADLLRIMVKAEGSPWSEDLKGQNALHCLAKVCLDLPLPENLQSAAVSITNENQTRREQYLKYLLGVGVDPNDYDKAGYTPLMAFIMHSWPSEDDAVKSRILRLLIKAGANIHRRNREGETALHIAVKLGHRAATELLLSHQANIHARTNEQLGVLALGYQYCSQVEGKKSSHFAKKLGRRAITKLSRKHDSKQYTNSLATIEEGGGRDPKSDGSLYAQIMLCISLVINAGGVSEPTYVQEWASLERIQDCGSKSNQ